MPQSINPDALGLEDVDDDVAAIVIEPRADEERKSVRVELVGKIYSVKPPKAAFGMKYALAGDSDPGTMMKLTVAWLKAAFKKEDAQEIVNRLQDSDDLLDIQHIMRLIEALVEHVSGNPTS